MYVIKTIGKKGTLFLVDRKKTKKYWWTYKIELAMIFLSIVTADKVATGYKYNSPTVITLDEAKRIRKKIEDKHYRCNFDDIENTMHPFDPYSLGQE